MVEPLEPRRLLAKVAPLEIEHFTVSPTLDTLEKDLRAATEAFLARVPGAVVQSTHRPYEYQEHFRELRDKYVELLAQPGISQSGGTLEVTGSEGEENRALVDQVNADLRGHGIARQGPDFVPSVSKPERSRHTELPATAVDIGPRGSGTLAGLPYSEIDKIAKEVGLYRPYKSTDVVHFELIPSDTAFVIDATGSMSDDIAAVKAQASTIINRVFEQDERARVSVVLYKDAGDDFVARTVLGFTSDQAAINSAIQSISVDGGGDFPEAVYAGLMQAIRNAGEWNGGKKNIILLGDAPAHDPDEATGDTLASVVAAAKSIGATIGGDASFFASSLAVEGDDEPNGYVDETLEDFTGVPAADGTRPARVYAITVGSDASAIDSFQAIADATGGSYFSAADADEVVAAVLGALEEAATDPDLAPAPVLAEGVLRIEGTVADDVIRVTLVGDTVNVDVNGAITPFAAASVVQVDIFGGAGDDDVILGDGVGYAVVRGGPGNDLLVGGDGPDALYGEAGNDILRGHGGGDLLDGGDGDDDLHGNEGDDTVDGGLGDDRLIGGDGVDAVSYMGRTAGVSLDLLAGSGGAGGEVDSLAEFENAVGGAGDDVLVGDAQANFLVGLAGDDTLSGGDGKDTLLGGDGADELRGGDDTDTLIALAGLFADAAPDRLFGGGGVDFLLADDADEDDADDVLNGGAAELHRSVDDYLAALA